MKLNLIRKTISLICLLLMLFSINSLTTAQNSQIFTPAELAKFNGRNGSPAYVAVNGNVYDLTNVPEWANGSHFCPNAFAGKDITFLWNLVPRSHRNPVFLKRFIVVGKLVAERSPKPSETKTIPASPAPAMSPLPSRHPLPPESPTPKVVSNSKNLLIGLSLAALITAVWMLIRLKNK